jgi:hypothetical protein
VEERRFSAAIGFCSERASAPVDGFAGTHETTTGLKPASIPFQYAALNGPLFHASYLLTSGAGYSGNFSLF